MSRPSAGCGASLAGLRFSGRGSRASPSLTTVSNSRPWPMIVMICALLSCASSCAVRACAFSAARVARSPPRSTSPRARITLPRPNAGLASNRRSLHATRAALSSRKSRLPARSERGRELRYRDALARDRRHSTPSGGCAADPSRDASSSAQERQIVPPQPAHGCRSRRPCDSVVEVQPLARQCARSSRIVLPGVSFDGCTANRSRVAFPIPSSFSVARAGICAVGPRRSSSRLAITRATSPRVGRAHVATNARLAARVATLSRNAAVPSLSIIAGNTLANAAFTSSPPVRCGIALQREDGAGRASRAASREEQRHVASRKR